mmetsp:Transcript_16697/g.33351  ORF Transcript_16697/g.33351 Transcript_16697/m.33351 type:complete len:173 (-) Transcript_16697:123-641(-)|eukprot:CAMPEP_0181315044 /NCGR_PEP_ID=MMETSP1101-20121128/15153_1 /TAXON_ID=46948 /ORGANISM="Rhodomonas abbreviata, Strain Caron Lab Isolate" /LENGTH=172 /DNA_ID=CAMNT_0023422201 /DNA_START=423 /DNA_END=941 /DNA_ORIENTATION=+
MSEVAANDLAGGWALDTVPAVLRCELMDKLPCFFPLEEITKRQFLGLVLGPLRARETHLSKELEKLPSGQAPARVRAREQLTKQIQDSRAATRAVSAWMAAMPEQTVRFFSRWQLIRSVDTHFGSYDTKELHLVALLGEEPDEQGDGRRGCLLEVSAAFDKSLATREESVGS